MKKHLRILLLMDDACIPDRADNYLRTASRKATEYHIITALQNLGHTVDIFGVTNSASAIISVIEKKHPDLVVNQTEEFNHRRKLDYAVTALLEMLDIPFSGTGTTGLLLCRNKALCKQVLCSHNIRVPRFFVIPMGKQLSVPQPLSFPAVVKPLAQDGSDGISNDSLVYNKSSMQKRARYIHKKWNEPAIVEEYITGREIYASVIGNRHLKVLPPWEIRLPSDTTRGPKLATYTVKWDKAFRKKWGITLGPSDLPSPVLKQFTTIAKTVFQSLQMQDYGRVDMRLTPEGELVFLEANPNPDIGKREEVASSAAMSGITYTKLIDGIIRDALGRHRNKH